MHVGSSWQGIGWGGVAQSVTGLLMRAEAECRGRGLEQCEEMVQRRHCWRILSLCMSETEKRKKYYVLGDSRRPVGRSQLDVKLGLTP